MIRRLFCYTLIAGALAAPCARAQDAQAVVKTAEYALGMIRGPQRIDAINTLEYWGTGSTYAFGQSYRPDSAWPEFKVTYHASLSYAVPAMRVDVTRSNPDGLIQGGGGLPLAAPQRQIQVMSGKFAWNESVPGAGFIPGSAATPTPGAVNDRLLQLWTLPFGVLKMAVKAGSAAKVTTEGGATVITFPLSGALQGIITKVTLNAKNQPERVETRTSDPVLGDMVTETTYSDYKDLGEITTDVQFPSHIVEKQGGFPVLDLTVTKADPNNPYVVFPVPDNVEKAPPAAVKVETQKVSEGVWYLTGGTHHSVAVEFKNYVALVECPLNDDRAVAVIDAVKKTIPNKPIRYVVNSHHHFDHLGGLRACVAEGATILTAAENKPYYEKVWAMPHTLSPDRLAKVPKKPVIEAVADKRVLTDGTQTLELYHLQGTNHADTMLIGYLPKAKVLIEADVYNPAPPIASPGPVVKESVNLYENIKRLNLDVQQITPLHGRLVAISDLRKAIGQN
ncbi:MAG: MBL fold metallo-hydrolase [Acidobacteria bacterium]|nr:MAG: MBL fold metallo-hydrolase [Acidobacteriota bacterium]